MVASVADRGGGLVEAAVGGLVEQEGGDVGGGDAGADLVAAEVAGADGAGAPGVGGAGEARDSPVEVAVGNDLRHAQQLAVGAREEGAAHEGDEPAEQAGLVARVAQGWGWPCR